MAQSSSSTYKALVSCDDIMNIDWDLAENVYFGNGGTNLLVILRYFNFSIVS